MRSISKNLKVKRIENGLPYNLSGQGTNKQTRETQTRENQPSQGGVRLARRLAKNCWGGRLDEGR